ncbi:capsid scaffolding serine peptidase GPO [Sphingomonas faeni]|uniref:Capsid scaffolding serine peptidase GPO n=1 Tax=Sphingomonas faeni TaxID=185950 RepID=A0A2T5TZM4_9SPHN|nr:GPO family capsid scaffolding protein [Sphingomonas faeni]PTW44699.1 capsid scaffolding serine peptidase GPO [Sphingomonas faeni]
MGTKSKPFRSFVEGETISDGRKVTAEMIDECVATFAPATYSPRINIEHVSGYSPEPPFNGYGDVVALEAKTDDIVIAGKTEKRRALYTTVEGNDQLVALARADQKPYPSVELTPNYAGTGKFGIIGLAFTDTPASIGTQRLQFSHRAPGTVFASAADAVTIEFEAKKAEDEKVDSIVDRLFSALSAKFKPNEPDKPKEEPKPKSANDNFDFDPAAFTADIKTVITGVVTAALKPVIETQTANQREFATLKTQLANTEQPGFSRSPASGGGDDAVTDC